MHIPVASLFPGSSSAPSLLVLDTTHTPLLPRLPIKLGDANLDRYTDLLFVVDQLDVQHARTPKLIMSVPCAKDVVGCGVPRTLAEEPRIVLLSDDSKCLSQVHFDHSVS